MRAYVRHGFPVWPIPHRPYRADDIVEFHRLSHSLHYQIGYLKAHRNKAMRELIGPPEFNGPEYDRQEYSGEIINGRVYNGVTHLHYLCLRGMDNECFRRDIETCHRYLHHMRRCTGPMLP